MANSQFGQFDQGSPPRALALSCPDVDLAGAESILATHGLALLPVGGHGDLDRAAAVTTLFIIEVTDEGARSAVTWRADLAMYVPLNTPSPDQLLPPSWVSRYPDAYAQARQPAVTDSASEAELWDDEDEPGHVQVFVPIDELVALPREQWVFTNELVPKQQRRGRRFAPRVPTLVDIPD
jgi:hypothetical protein